MYNFDESYWDILGSGFSASGDAWEQREGNPNYVRPNSSISTRGTDIIVFSQSIPPVSGSDATEDWIYGGILEIYNDTLRTDPPTVTAGQTYSGCTIPTAEEWNAMTTEEQNDFKNTYFEPTTPTSTTKIGLPFEDYYAVYAWVGVVVRGGDYPTDPNFPYYVIWGDLTTTNSRKTLNYNLETDTPTYIDLNVIMAENFKPEEEGVFRALIIQTQQTQYTRFWTGYSSSGTLTYTYSSRGRNPEPCNSVSFNLRKFDWKMKADKNNGYPYKRDVEAFDFDLLVKPMPFFMWTMKPEENQGYPTLGGKEINALGAFGNCKQLKSVIIPESVSEIGEYGFAETGLGTVTISSECTYSSTSFPPSCIVNYYEE